MRAVLNDSQRAVLLATIMTISVVTTAMGAVGSVAANPNSGADIVVQEGESIQQAVNDASPGDVIAVEQGLYEETVRVNKSDITIKAKDPANPPTVRHQPNEPAQNATFEIIESGVILSNLTIERVGHPAREGNNSTAAVAIVPVDSDRPDCRFTFSGCDDVTKDVTIKSNEVVGDFPLENDSAGGVVITDGTEYMFVVETAGDASNITIENNEVHNFSGGVGLLADYGGTITDVEITGNHVFDNRAINNSTPEGVGVGFARNTTQGYFDNVRVTDNNLTGNHYGVRLAGPEDDEDLEEVDASGITVNYNDIVGNSEWGVMNNGTNVLDAENNWWGDADGPSGEGPGNGDAVSTGVDYDPWLENSTT
jgi:hypothetical protein